MWRCGIVLALVAVSPCRSAEASEITVCCDPSAPSHLCPSASVVQPEWRLGNGVVVQWNARGKIKAVQVTTSETVKDWTSSGVEEAYTKLEDQAVAALQKVLLPATGATANSLAAIFSADMAKRISELPKIQKKLKSLCKKDRRPAVKCKGDDCTMMIFQPSPIDCGRLPEIAARADKLLDPLTSAINSTVAQLPGLDFPKGKGGFPRHAEVTKDLVEKSQTAFVLIKIVPDGTWLEKQVVQFKPDLDLSPEAGSSAPRPSRCDRPIDSIGAFFDAQDSDPIVVSGRRKQVMEIYKKFQVRP